MSETDSNQIAAESVGAASMMTSLPSATDYRGKLYGGSYPYQ